jgi:hypothetical protein
MEKNEAKEKFRLADRLFAEQQFAAALKVLTELNAAFPNERHVLYPMARCLAGLGRNGEALDLADRVIRQFNYGPAIELYKKLKELKTGTGLAALESQSDPPNLPGAMKFDSDPIELPGGMPKFDSDLPALPSEFESMIDGPAKSYGGAPPPLPAATGPDWKPLGMWIGLTAGSWLVMVMVAVTIGRPYFEFLIDLFKNFQAHMDSGEFPQAPWGPYLAVWLTNSLFAYLVACWCAYWCVAAMGASLHNEFADNMKDAAIWALIGTGLAIIPIIGWIIFLVMLKRHYELTIGKLLGVVSLFMAFDMLFSMVAGAAYWGVVIGAVA